MKLRFLSKNEWALLIDKYSIPTPFHSLDWLNILTEVWPETTIYLLAIEEGGDTVGLLPIIMKKKFGLTLIGSPLRGCFTPYQGPVLKDSKNFLYLNLLECLIQEFSPDFLEISLPTGLEINSEESKATIIVDLRKGAEALWKGMRKGTRSQVKQAQKVGVEVFSPTELGSWLSDYYSMVTDTYSRQKLPNPAPKKFYECLWNNLYPKGMLKVFLSKYEGKIIAGSFYLLWQEVLYGLDGSSFYEYHKVRANNLIEWETIAWAIKAGLTTYDMVGANMPGVAQFKLGFGGEIIRHPVFQVHPSILGRLAWHVYERFKPRIKKMIDI